MLPRSKGSRHYQTSTLLLAISHDSCPHACMMSLESTRGGGKMGIMFLFFLLQTPEREANKPSHERHGEPAAESQQHLGVQHCPHLLCPHPHQPGAAPALPRGPLAVSLVSGHSQLPSSIATRVCFHKVRVGGCPGSLRGYEASQGSPLAPALPCHAPPLSCNASPLGRRGPVALRGTPGVAPGKQHCRPPSRGTSATRTLRRETEF